MKQTKTIGSTSNWLHWHAELTPSPLSVSESPVSNDETIIAILLFKQCDMYVGKLIAHWSLYNESIDKTSKFESLFLLKKKATK